MDSTVGEIFEDIIKNDSAGFRLMAKELFDEELPRKYNVEPSEIDLFHNIVIDLSRFYGPEKPQIHHFSENLITAISKAIDELHSFCNEYCKQTYGTTSDHYYPFIRKLISYHHASYFQMRSFMKEETQMSRNLRTRFDQVSTMRNLSIVTFQKKDSSDAFSIPKEEIGDKETNLCDTLAHWLYPFANYLHANVIHEKALRGTAHPDYLIIGDNDICIPIEIKRDPYIQFYNDRYQNHRRILHQVGKYLHASRTSVGCLYSSRLLARINFDSVDKKLKIETYDHYHDQNNGLLSAWLGMIQDCPPRQLDATELEDLQMELENLDKDTKKGTK